ncbi:ArgR family transcriptional regulator [uncultured Actinomyces sp.]|uniref:arginine repressor n=1 Tax=uncultured Actinomyces sp. TaxID=249061 RepID=UPI002631FCB7|nr:ArgR family transcriptional regulator [uncultured Actinomyces sp.]
MKDSDNTRMPASKAGRHAAIEQILATQQIASQSDLREALEEVGIFVAQATLSRDLLEVRATKVRGVDGRQVYALANPERPVEWGEEGAEQKLQRWSQDLLVGGATANNLVVLRTPAGAANLLGSAIDFSRDETVLGSVAGDDTIIVVCVSDEAAQAYCDKLLKYAEGVKTSSQELQKEENK